MRNLVIRAATILAVLAAASTGPVYADNDGDHDGKDRSNRHEREDKVYELRRKGDLLPLAEILETVRKTYPGKIVEIDFDDKKSRAIYEIYILRQDGKVIEVEFDARTGADLGIEADH